MWKYVLERRSYEPFRHMFYPCSIKFNPSSWEWSIILDMSASYSIKGVRAIHYVLLGPLFNTQSVSLSIWWCKYFKRSHRLCFARMHGDANPSSFTSNSERILRLNQLKVRSRSLLANKLLFLISESVSSPPRTFSVIPSPSNLIFHKGSYNRIRNIFSLVIF